MERKTFIAASALAAALVTDACAKSANALELVEARSEFDYAAFSKLVDRPFAVRQLWDVDGYEPLALGGMKNALNGYEFGFGIAPSRIGLIACLHGSANAFAYSDAMWAKYKLGDAFGFKDPSGATVSSNIFFHARSRAVTTADPNDAGSMYQDGTLEALQRRGVIVLVCHTAAAEEARSLASGGFAPQGTSAGDVQRDLLAHLVPNVSVVPSMVATIGILQNRFKYAYITTGNSG